KPHWAPRSASHPRAVAIDGPPSDARREYFSAASRVLLTFFADWRFPFAPRRPAPYLSNLQETLTSCCPSCCPMSLIMSAFSPRAARAPLPFRAPAWPRQRPTQALKWRILPCSTWAVLIDGAARRPLASTVPAL